MPRNATHARESPPYPGESPEAPSTWLERPNHRCGSTNKLTSLQPHTFATGTRLGSIGMDGGIPLAGEGSFKVPSRELRQQLHPDLSAGNLAAPGHSVRLGQSRARRLLALHGHHKSSPREQGPASPPAAVLREISVLMQPPPPGLCREVVSILHLFLQVSGCE